MMITPTTTGTPGDSIVPGDASYPVKPGFSDPVYEAQRVLQLLRQAMAAPGLTVELDPVPVVAPLNAASMAICLAMLDMETPLWLDPSARLPRLQQHLDYHCECPLVDDPLKAHYILACTADNAPPMGACSTTQDDGEDGGVMIIQVATLNNSDPSVAVQTNGDEPRALGIGGLGNDFWQQPGLLGDGPERQVNLVFTHGNQLIAVPRSVRIMTPE